MKQTCILILSLAVALTSRAQIMGIGAKNMGLLSITNLSAEDVQFEVDGQQYVDCGANLNIRGLKPGNHLVKLYSGKTGTGIMGMKRIIIYNKTVYVKPQFYVDIIVNRFGRVLIDEQTITGNQYQDDSHGPWRNPVMSNTPPPPPPNNQPGNNRPPRNDYNNPPRPMADNTFNSFIETVRRESFDDSRMAIAKAGIDQNFFTSNQAKSLLAVFSFEASKLEIAKYMYGKTTDPKNYFVVYNAFTFSKSKEELADYVRTYH